MDDDGAPELEPTPEPEPGSFGPAFRDLFDPTGRGHWPVAAPLPKVAELLGEPLPRVRKAAEAVVPYLRSDGSEVYSLMLLERQLGLGQERKRPPRPGGGWRGQMTIPGTEGRRHQRARQRRG